MDKTIDRHLVLHALLMAVWKRQPREPVLVHSDQGSQYGSADYLAFMKENNLELSMSRRGNCLDNAVAESFFATFKKRVTQKLSATAWSARDVCIDLQKARIKIAIGILTNTLESGM